MRRVVALLAVLCVVGAMGVELAAAEPLAPKLRAKVRKKDDAVRLNWRTRKLDRRAVIVLEIERARDGAAFAPLDAVGRRPSRYDDRPEAGGTYDYRARVHSDDEVSAWSNVVTVEVPGAPVPGGADPGSGASGNPALKADQRECPAGTVDAVLQIVNQERSKARRGALRLNAQLQWAARKRTIDQAHSGKLSHDGWVSVINQSGYRWSALAENVALGPRSAAAVMDAWMNSAGHRSNILGGYRDIGIGCVIDRHGFYWWTQDFGT